MPFISVIPAIRTPFGVDAFDYAVDQDADVRIGDLILVPFRRRTIPALVAAMSDVSAFAGKTTDLKTPDLLVRFPPSLATALERTSARTFCSRPTVLQSWLRNIPKRAKPIAVPSSTTPRQGDATILTAQRVQTILAAAKQHTGRVLVLTPWRLRADAYAKALGTSTLHADMSDGSAWTAWTSFLSSTDGVLVATRIGSWLACAADVVIIDEPENDDYKQDELTPRIDHRWLLDEIKKIRPDVAVISVGTTPLLRDAPNLVVADIPSIDVPFDREPWQRTQRSSIESLSPATVNRIEEALEDETPVTILHPIRGDRARVVCRDCHWSANCPSCAFPLSREGNRGRCHRCGRTAEIPEICPSCGSTQLDRSRIGKDRLAETVARAYPNAPIHVTDLAEWHKDSLKPKSLVVITDISLIGGYAEDVRRRERLIIAWRRLAASVATAQGRIIVQGPEDLLASLPAWLTSDGLAAAWKSEWQDRNAFGYPPAKRLIKLIVNTDEQTAAAFIQRVTGMLPPNWKSSGPFPVTFRAATRSPRCIIHLHPPAEISENDIYHILEPFSKDAIIDIDPIAFYS